MTIDPYTSAHTGVVRLIADYYADGAIRRTGSGRILGWTHCQHDPDHGLT